jgi:hypothetical protein
MSVPPSNFLYIRVQEFSCVNKTGERKADEKMHKESVAIAVCRQQDAATACAHHF